jgi:hypothetical protein
MVDVYKTTTIWLDDKCEPKGYTWLGVNDMQVLLRNVKQGFKTNKKRLPIIGLREAVRFRARCELL